jgi:hypothetical protein
MLAVLMCASRAQFPLTSVLKGCMPLSVSLPAQMLEKGHLQPPNNFSAKWYVRIRI